VLSLSVATKAGVQKAKGGQRFIGAIVTGAVQGVSVGFKGY
jgi:hypothetical protein